MIWRVHQRVLAGLRVPYPRPRLVNTMHWQDMPFEIRYACRYWVYYLKEGHCAIRDDDVVNRFLDRYFFH